MFPTPDQQKAVTCGDHYIFAIAGPGSGKTRTLVWRVLWLIQSGVSPSTIACITFTNAGAKEMAKRLAQSDVQIGFVGTLHAFILKLIREHGRAIGYPDGKFTILDNEEAVQFFELVLDKFKWNGTAKEIVAAIQKGPPNGDTAMSKAEVVAAGYWLELRRNKLLTFDAILILGERLLKLMQDRITNVGGPIIYEIPFSHYLIDEVQDCSPIDFRIFALLQGQFFLVGDPDQSIYGFRGADVSLCMALTRDPKWTVIPLEGNFRSGANICQVAQNLIEHNNDRFSKKTVSAIDAPGNVQFARFASEPVEASFITQEISRLANPSEIAVLLRTNDLVDAYANHLRARSIPVAQSRPPTRPADWPKTKMILAYVFQPMNDALAYRCCSHLVNRGFAEEIKAKAAMSFTSFNQQWEQLERLSFEDFFTAARTHFRRLGISDASLNRVLEAHERLPEGSSSADLLVELGREDENIVGEGVTVCTIHAAKGREWDHVFLAACEQAVMPSERKSLNLPEERRIAYVAVTRARLRLAVTWCEARTQKWGKSPFPVDASPSQFIQEMKRDQIFSA